MKRFIFIFLSSLFISISANAIDIHWSSTKPHGLVVFLETMSEQPHRSEGMRTFFLETPTYKKTSTKKIIVSFKKITANGWENVFEPKEKDAYHRFLTAAIQSESLKELEGKTKSLFRKEIESNFFSILEQFEPIYTSTVWSIYEPQLQQLTKEVQKMYDEHRSIVDSISIFYGAKDIAQTLSVGFYPLVQKDGPIYAENMGEAQSVGILIGNTNTLDRVGTIMHEFSHYFFNHESEEMKRIRNLTFRKSTSPDKAFSYAFTDEMLATVCGSGWAPEKIAGKNDDPVWYADETIEKFARAVYPVAKVYLDQSKPMDREFYSAIIPIFSKTFPSYSKTHRISMGNVVAFTDNDFVPRYVITTSLQSTFDSRLTRIVSPFDDEKTKLDLENNPNSTRLYILSKSAIPRAKTYFANVPELKSFADKIEFKKKTFQIFQNQEKISVIIIYADNADEFKLAMLKLHDKTDNIH